MSARVNVGVVDVRCHLGDARRVRARRAGGRGVRRAPQVCVAVQAQTARVGAPLRFEIRPRQRFGFGGAGGFLCGGQLCGGGCAVDDGEVVARPLAQPGGALRPRCDAVAVDAGDLGHPGVRVDGSEFEAALGMQ